MHAGGSSPKGAAALAYCSLSLLLAWLGAIHGTAVDCDGTMLQIQDGLYSISGAALQSRVNVSQGNVTDDEHVATSGVDHSATIPRSLPLLGSRWPQLGQKWRLYVLS